MYRYRKIEVRKGRLLWSARPVNTCEPEGMDLVPSYNLCGEVWWHGFTRKQAIARAQRYARRQNRRSDRDESIEVVSLGDS